MDEVELFEIDPAELPDYPEESDADTATALTLTEDVDPDVSLAPVAAESAKTAQKGGVSMKALKIKDLVPDIRLHKGLVDPIIETNLGVALGGDRTGTNLVPIRMLEDGTPDVESLYGTILSPAEHLMLPDGEIVPGLLYNNAVKIKSLSAQVDGEMVPQGMFFDLGKYAQALNVYVRSGEGDLESLTRDACEEVQLRHKKHVIRAHCGIVLRGVTAFQRGGRRGELGISLPMAERLLQVLQAKMGDLAPKTVADLNGLAVRVKRFPIANRASIKTMRLRVVLDQVLAFRIHDEDVKEMLGDYDGDQLFLGFPQGYLEFQQAQKDMGTLDFMAAEQDPDRVYPMEFSLTDVRAFGWPEPVAMVQGMGAKSFQGTVCFGGERLAISASILYHEGLDAALAARFDQDKPSIYATHVAWITGLVKDSIGPLYEVVFDFRKSWTGADGVEHPNGEFREELMAMLRVFRGVDTRISDIVRNIKKSDGSVNVGVDVDLYNSILGALKEEETMIEFLRRYPVQGTLVGGDHLSIGAIRRLAGYVAENRVARYLSACSGHLIEEADLAFEPDEQVGEIVYEAKPISTEALPIWDGSVGPWQFVVECARWSKAFDCHLVSEGKGGVKIRLTLKVDKRIEVRLIELPDIRVSAVPPAEDGSTMGILTLKVPGGEMRNARMIVRSRNPRLGLTCETFEVELVTLLHLLGEQIGGFSREMFAAMKRGAPVHSASHMSTELMKTVGKYALPKGEGKEVNFDKHEVAVLLAEQGGPEESMAANAAVLDLVASQTFVNPLDGVTEHRFDISCTSKNHPGTVAWLMVPVRRQTRDGCEVEWLPNHPLIRYVANVWIDSDRQMRESRTVRFAALFDEEMPLRVRNGLEDTMPGITRRRRDAVWVGVNGMDWMFSSVKANGDPGRITPFGMKVYARKSRPSVQGPWALEVCEDFAIERGFDGLDAMTDAGWTFKRTPRMIGKVDGLLLFEDLFTLIGPEEGRPTWHKIFFSGHKFVATPCQHDYFVRVGDELVPVAGFVPIETLVQKKLHGSMACALSVLLGRDYFGAFADQPVDPRRKGGDAADAYDDIVKDVAGRLAERGLPAHGRMPIIRADGHVMGEGWAGIYPTFVLKEDDKISTGVSDNDAPNSALDLRMIGEHIEMPKSVMGEMQTFCDFIAGKKVDVDSMTVIEHDPRPAPAPKPVSAAAEEDELNWEGLALYGVPML